MRAHEVDSDGIPAGENETCRLGCRIKWAIPLAAHNAVDNTEQASRGIVSKTTVAAGVHKYAVQIDYHPPGRIVTVPVARTNRVRICVSEEALAERL